MLPQNDLSALSTEHFLDVSGSAPPILAGHLKLGGVNPQGRSFEFNSFYLLHNDLPCIPVMGEFHFSRYPRRDWEVELLKMKAGGIEIVATYIFWIHIEADEGAFDWADNKDLRAFITLCGALGLDAVVRIGPFAHGECRNGGFPDWLYGRPFATRSGDARYLAYVERFYQAISTQLEGLLFKDGGPVIGIQIENEYMHTGAPWEVTYRTGTEWVPRGSEGSAHMATLKNLAQRVGLDAPIYTCTGWLNSPIVDGEMLPMHGGYVFTPWSPDPSYVQPPTTEFIFRDRHRTPLLTGAPTYDPVRYPYICCEIGGGIQDTYYHRNIVPPEAIEALTVMNLAGGANWIGYYMYHGGSNPISKQSYLNEYTVPRISYDFQAPLREFGQVADSFRYLRILHLFLKDFGDLLAPMTACVPSDAAAIVPTDTESLRFAARTKDGSGFVFLNNYQDHVEMHDLTDIRLTLRTGEGMLTIPHGEPLTLAKHVAAIIPFGLILGSIRLEYATTQLLTKIQTAGATDYFFFAPHKMRSEYAFSAASFRKLTVEGGTTIDVADTTYVTVTPGTACLITLEAISGEVVRIFTLTRAQAENATKVTLAGQTRLFISEDTLLEKGAVGALHHVGNSEVGFSLYPPFEGVIESPNGNFEAATDGQFTHYALKLAEHPIPFEMESIGANKVCLSFPPNFLDGLDDVYLRIDYVGDMGNAFIDGRLVSDNFYNGTAWEIGLRRFADQLSSKELLIMITPIAPQAQNARYLPTGMAFQPDVNQAGISLIRSITAVPVYQIPLTLIPASEGG